MKTGQSKRLERLETATSGRVCFISKQIWPDGEDDPDFERKCEDAEARGDQVVTVEFVDGEEWTNIGKSEVGGEWPTGPAEGEDQGKEAQ